MSENVECEQLRLFDAGGIDLAKLRSARENLKAPPRSINTLAAYEIGWRQFGEWCARVGRPALPASADTVTLYVTWLLLEQRRKTATAIQHLSSIMHYHRAAKQKLPAKEEARNVITAIRRERRERHEGALAMGVPELVRISRACPASTNHGARDRAIIVLGFASGLRRSELAALTLADITFESKGLAVMVRHSKTDQDSRGRIVGVWAGRRASTDPVRVLRNWIRKRGRTPGPLFLRITAGTRITNRGISPRAINNALKSAVARAGFDPNRYSAHSLRAGAVTASAELGRSDQEIMGLSGHASSTVMRTYVRPTRVFAGRNPLAGAL